MKVLPWQLKSLSYLATVSQLVLFCPLWLTLGPCHHHQGSKPRLTSLLMRGMWSRALVGLLCSQPTPEVEPLLCKRPQICEWAQPRPARFYLTEPSSHFPVHRSSVMSDTYDCLIHWVFRYFVLQHEWPIKKSVPRSGVLL